MPPSLKEQFHQEYLDTPWQRLRFHFLLRRVRQVKLVGLWEANLDKLFLETQYKQALEYNDAADRKVLGEENRKALTDQNSAKIAELEQRITINNSVKANWRKNEAFRNETRAYVQMLDLWLKAN